MGRVIVLGSINMDCVATVAKHPAPGETVPGTNLNYFPGGKGANQAVAAARLGATVILLGCVGNDGFADFMIDFLGNENIDLSNIKETEGATGTALIAVNATGENTIIVVSGANGKVDTSMANTFEFQPNDILVCQNEIPSDAMHVAFQQAQKNNATVIYNPAPAIDVPTELFDLADIVIVNETEYQHYRSQITGDTQTIIQTLGPNGIKIQQHKNEYDIAGHSVSVKDTTGAGDCFAGALAARLSKGDNLQDASVYANKAASLAVQKHGAGTAMPRSPEIV